MKIEKWDELGMDKLITKILDVHSHVKKHHFGDRPFMTPYQIAIEFQKQCLHEFDEIGLEVGGEGTGVHVSLTQSIAWELSQRIGAGKIKNVEGRFLYLKHLKVLQYTDKDRCPVPSSPHSPSDLSLFRLKD